MLGGEPPTREDRAVATLAEARDVANETQSFRFDGELDVVATSDERRETVEATLRGNVSVADRRLVTRTHVQGETLEGYVVGDTAYQECAMMGTFWARSNVTTDDWAATTPLSRQLALLESGSLYYNGTTTVDGETATMLDGEPTTEALTQFQERRPGQVVGSEAVEDPRIRVWLDPDTNRTNRITLEFDVSEGDATGSTTLTTRYSDYGEPVSITLPEEATDDPVTGGCPGG